MYAVEFQANIKDGTIEVPAAYRQRLRGTVRVIVMTQEMQPAFDMIDHLLNNPIKAPGFTRLKRDNIYTR